MSGEGILCLVLNMNICPDCNAFLHSDKLDFLDIILIAICSCLSCPLILVKFSEFLPYKHPQAGFEPGTFGTNCVWTLLTPKPTQPPRLDFFTFPVSVSFWLTEAKHKKPFGNPTPPSIHQECGDNQPFPVRWWIATFFLVLGKTLEKINDNG